MHRDFRYEADFLKEARGYPMKGEEPSSQGKAFA
jgi:hypothetical protein